MKGSGEVSWCGVNGIIACVQEMERAREGVAIVLNDVWHSAVVDFICISFTEESCGVSSSSHGVVVIPVTTVERALPAFFAALPPSTSETHSIFISTKKQCKSIA